MYSTLILLVLSSLVAAQNHDGFKIVILGEVSTGKTSLMWSLFGDGKSNKSTGIIIFYAVTTPHL